MFSSELAVKQRYLRQMLANKSGSPRVQRPSPEGGAASQPYTTLKRSDFASSGCLVGPSAFRSSLESVCSPHKPGRPFERKKETRLLCEGCSARLDFFREEALRALKDGDFSTNDPKISALLYESVQTPPLSELSGRCDVCFVHLSQLKREAVRMLLTTDRAIWPTPVRANVPPGRPAAGAHTLPRTCTSPSPGLGLGSHQRLGNLETGSTARESPRLEAMRTQASNKANSAYTTSQDAVKKKKESDKAASSETVLCHFSSPLPFNPSRVSNMLPAGTSAAVSFIVRAVQKLNLTSRRRKQNSDNGCSRHPTNFSGLLQKAPPPTPSNLLQTSSKSRDISETGKVKVMLRVSPSSDVSPTLRLDLRRRQVTVLEPATQNTARTASGISFTPKTFTFDAAFGPESTQAEVCERSLFDVLQSVIAGADGCILSFGPTCVGTSYTMIGSDDNTPSLGIIPCAISWLFKLINKKKDRTWANISVSVSAVEVCGESEIIRDLLVEVDSCDRKVPREPNVCLLEDPVCGIQLRNNSLISAPTSERAAFLLDAALAARSSSFNGCGGTFQHRCHMFYTLHVYQRHLESTKSGMCVDQSKLSLIDLGTCTKDKNKNNTAACLVDLGNVITAKLGGSVLNKGSKLSMLMQQSLGNINCCTTIVAHVSSSHEDLLETICTIQVVSRIRRLQNKSRKSAPSSPGERTFGKEKKRNDSTRLRSFYSAGTLDRGLSLPHLFDDPEGRFLSYKSCDSVISVNPAGGVLSDKVKVKGSQEFVPIIPSLQRSKTDLQRSFSLKNCDHIHSISQNLFSPKKEAKRQLAQPKAPGFGIPDLECLKCNTFAELQDRLGCIDANDVVERHSCNTQPASALIKSESPSIKTVKTVIPFTQPELKGSPNKKDITLIHSSPAKTVHQQLPCSSRSDMDRNYIPSVQTIGSKITSETKDTTASLPPPVERLPSDDSTVPPEFRISPVGKSSSSSLSAGLESPVSIPVSLNEVIPQFSSENQREMKATITVTVQQPLDLNGHDELVYSVVEEVTISEAVNRGKASSNLPPITHSHSLEGLPSESHPVRIIGSVGEEETQLNPVSPAQAKDKISKISSVVSGGKALVQNFVVNSDIKDMVDSYRDNLSEESQNKGQSTEKDISVGAKAFDPFAVRPQDQGPRKNLCENKSEQKASKRNCKQGNGKHFSEISASFSPVIESPENPISSYSAYSTNSPTRDWPSLDNYDEYSEPLQHFHDWRNENIYRPREELERKQCPSKFAFIEKKIKDKNVMTSGQKSNKDSPKSRNGQHTQLFLAHCMELDYPTSSNKLDKTNPNSPVLEESSKLFSAKLEQIANRSRSLGRAFQGSSERLNGGHSSPRADRRHPEKNHCVALDTNESLEFDYATSQATRLTSPGLSRSYEEDLTRSWTGHSSRRVPKFFPMHNFEANDTTQPTKQSKTLSVNKVLSSPKLSRMSGTIPKNSCGSPRSMKHSRSSSLSPDGFSFRQFSWSSQSLSRKQEKSAFFSRSSSRILNERVELLRSREDSLSSSSQSSLEMEELEESRGRPKIPVCPLPSPYSRVTAPRKPNRCSGHASDNTSVLSGDLPPAMCKTAVLYSRNSMVSSGYESMVRDSEATCSSMSAHDSISDQSCFYSTGRGARSSKKRNNSSSYQRRPSQDTLLSLRRSASGSKIRWVDRGTSDSYEIKVYEIENVDGLQKRGEAGNKNVICFSAKLKFLEHRQQRIAEVRAKYNALKRELELAKQHLMVDPGKWTREFDLWQTFEVDSLEHLEALELVTQRLESRVGRCKSRVMMVTCFDALPKRRQKKRQRPPGDYKRLMKI